MEMNNTKEIIALEFGANLIEQGFVKGMTVDEYLKRYEECVTNY